MRILMVMAHPDDEVIFGWPILQDKKIQKDILCLSDDTDNPDRPWCKNRAKALNEICSGSSTCLKAETLHYPSEFYRSPTRREIDPDFRLSTIMEKTEISIERELWRHKYDAIFTHNPIGEYGNIDHILTHIIAMSFDVQIWFTDIFIPSNWMPFKKMPAVYRRIYYRKKLFNAVNNLTEYGECEKIYRKHGCWTWGKPPVKECGIYVI